MTGPSGTRLRDDGKSSAVRFRDRRDAGWVLGRRLASRRRADHSVALELPLDVVVSRRLRHPDQPESAIGAVAEGGERYLTPRLVSPSAAWQGYVEREIGHQRAEIVRRQQLYRGGMPLVLGRSARVILVDDGVETAATVIAPRSMPCAVSRSPGSCSPLRSCRSRRCGGSRRSSTRSSPSPPPGSSGATRGFYEDFKQVSEAEVCELLDQAHRELPPVRTGA